MMLRPLSALLPLFAMAALGGTVLSVLAAAPPPTVSITLPANNLPGDALAVNDQQLIYTQPDPLIHPQSAAFAQFTNFHMRVYSVSLAGPVGPQRITSTPHLLFVSPRGANVTPWSVEGNWLVYSQYSNTDQAAPWMLAARNTGTGRVIILDTTAREGVPSFGAQAASDGRTIVWQSWTILQGRSTSVIRAYDMATGHRIIVTEGGSPTTWSYAWPAVAGRRVVFERETPFAKKPQAQILLASLDTGHIQTLSAAAAANSEPAISGDLIVWKQGWRYAGGRGVTVYNARTGRSHTLSGTDIDQPKVTDGRYVLYPSGSTVKLYDALAGRTTTVASPQPDGYGPGNQVVAGDHMVIAKLGKFTTTTTQFPVRLLITKLP